MQVALRETITVGGDRHIYLERFNFAQKEKKSLET